MKKLTNTFKVLHKNGHNINETQNSRFREDLVANIYIKISNLWMAPRKKTHVRIVN
jgi:hypothetical protein